MTGKSRWPLISFRTLTANNGHEGGFGHETGNNGQVSGESNNFWPLESQ